MTLKNRVKRLDYRDFNSRTQLEVGLEGSDLREQAFCYFGRHRKADPGVDKAQDPEKLSIYSCRLCCISNAVGPPNCNTEGRLLRRIAIHIKVLEPFSVCASLMEILCCL